MGWFSEKPQAAPDKSHRLVCWDARDKFFECLDKNGIQNSLDIKAKDEVESNCGSLRQEFKDKCVASWFKYFQEKRYNDILRDLRVKQLEAEGAQPLPFNLSR